MFDTTARLATEKQGLPACLPLVSFTGSERAAMFVLESEQLVAISVNDECQIVLNMPDDECGNCGKAGSTVMFFGPARARAVAQEMMRLADELDAIKSAVE